MPGWAEGGRLGAVLAGLTGTEVREEFGVTGAAPRICGKRHPGFLVMRAFHNGLLGLAFVATLPSLACKRGDVDRPPSGSGGAVGAVADDLKGVAKQTEKTAKDIGHATAGLADKASEHLEHLTNHAGAESQDAWITTKVKSALTSQGLDPLHVHVDTNEKVVTLSGTVPSAAERDKAVSAARTVTEVAGVTDHLFVKPDGH